MESVSFDMVSHIARCVPNAADNLLNEKPFTYTIHDEYKELKGFNNIIWILSKVLLNTYI